eukprot:5179109-Pleurochrysis_carterae.AAC.2
MITPRHGGTIASNTSAKPKQRWEAAGTTTSSSCASSPWVFDSTGSPSPDTRALLGCSPEVHACEGAASFAFHATVPTASPVSTEYPTPRVGLALTPWQGIAVLACVYIITLTPPPRGIPGSLPPSPPGSDDEASDNDFAAHYPQPSEGEEEFMGFQPDRSRKARDNDDVRRFTAAAQARRGSNTPSFVDVQAPSSAVEGSTSRASDSVRSSLADVPPAFRVPHPIQTSAFPQLPQSEPSPAKSVVSRICSQLREADSLVADKLANSVRKINDGLHTLLDVQLAVTHGSGDGAHALNYSLCNRGARGARGVQADRS